MHKTALEKPIQTKVIPTQSQLGVLTHVKLTYHEIECIEIALLGLAEHIRNKDLPQRLADYSVHHLLAQLGYLRYWINKPILKSQCRLDGANSILWPCTSSELIDWLLTICLSCISEEAILMAATEATTLETTAFFKPCLENESSDSWADEMMCCNFSAFQHYYNHIVASCQERLIRKLIRIQTQGYPLFPNYSTH